MKNILNAIILILLTLSMHAGGEDYTKTIRGQVTDRLTRQSLPGASIVVLGSDPLMGTSSDADGYFTLENVPIRDHFNH